MENQQKYNLKISSIISNKFKVLYENYQVDLINILRQYLKNTNYNYTFRKQVSIIVDTNLNEEYSVVIKKKIGIR